MEETFERPLNFELADKLEAERDLTDEEFAAVLLCDYPGFSEYLAEKARTVREKYYGKSVYLRGLIEISNICKNNCLYCGIRRDNANAERYRLNKEQILACSDAGYDLGENIIVDGICEVIYIDVVSRAKPRNRDRMRTYAVNSFKVLGMH